jgi:hypothetical protein
MKGYKVVRRGENGWESCAIGHPYSKSYRVGGTTRRPKDGGPLCVFGSKSAAIQMSHAFLPIYPLRVYLCEYTPSSDHWVWTSVGSPIPAYWLYPSTHLADSVTLIERIK